MDGSERVTKRNRRFLRSIRAFQDILWDLKQSMGVQVAPAGDHRQGVSPQVPGQVTGPVDEAGQSMASTQDKEDQERRRLSPSSQQEICESSRTRKSPDFLVVGSVDDPKFNHKKQ